MVHGFGCEFISAFSNGNNIIKSRDWLTAWALSLSLWFSFYFVGKPDSAAHLSL